MPDLEKALKAAAQRELLTLWDALEQSGATTLVTCKTPPQRIAGLLPALIGFWLARRMLIGRWGGLTDVGT